MIIPVLSVCLSCSRQAAFSCLGRMEMLLEAKNSNAKAGRGLFDSLYVQVVCSLMWLFGLMKSHTSAASVLCPEQPPWLFMVSWPLHHLCWLLSSWVPSQAGVLALFSLVPGLQAPGTAGAWRMVGKGGGSLKKARKGGRRGSGLDE